MERLETRCSSMGWSGVSKAKRALGRCLKRPSQGETGSPNQESNVLPLSRKRSLSIEIPSDEGRISRRPLHFEHAMTESVFTDCGRYAVLLCLHANRNRDLCGHVSELSQGRKQ